jgi:hypothetical protein
MHGHIVGWEFDARRLRRRRWTPMSVIIALILGVIALVIALTLMMMAFAGAILVGGAYLGYRVLRGVVMEKPAVLEPARTRKGRLPRETRGLLEMARTPDPLDRYLIAVTEFDRLSGAVLEIDPATLGRGRTLRRANELAEQSLNLHDAVAEIERQVAADPRAGGAMTNIWELAVATGDLWSYCREIRDIRRTPSLMEIRALVSRRTALLSRRDALVIRLRDADLRRVGTGGERARHTLDV